MARFTWPTPSKDYFRKGLSIQDTESTNSRIDRYMFLWSEFGPPSSMLLFGGIPAMFALEELKRSFATGNFMATVLLSQAFVELTLAAHFDLDGDEKIAHGSFKQLINVAYSRNWITEENALSLHKLRQMRNPYLHRSIRSGRHSYMERIPANRTAPEDLVEEDARFAVKSVVDFMRHGSPNWHPKNVQWREDVD